MDTNQAWINLFRRIPANLHDALAMGLTTGSEIVVQKIVKLEPDVMMIRGRLAGTQDTGRVVLIPYGQLTFVAITREMKDSEVESIFGKGASPALAEPVEEEAPASEPQVEVSPVKKPAPVSKSALVAKLRDRLKEGEK